MNGKKMNRKILPWILPVILGLILTACNPLNGSAQVGGACVNGNCHGSFSNHGGSPVPANAPSASIPGIPAAPSPLPQPAVTVTQTVYVDVSSCVPVTEVYLDSLGDNPGGPSDVLVTLAQCLQIPQGNQQVFEDQVEAYALIARQSGLFSTYSGRWSWVHEQPGVRVLCPDGRVVYSLADIYGQYNGN